MSRYVALRSVTLVSVVLLAPHIFCLSAQAALKGACAKVNITPPLGIGLIGSKGQPSDAVMDELYAKALVLSDGRNTLAIVSADLLYTPLEEITNPVRDIVGETVGIGRQNVMVCATHTHSGPEVFTRSKLGPKSRVPISQIDQSYLQTLVRKMAGAVLIAHRNMGEVRIGAGMGRLEEVLYNRRPRTSDSRVEMAFTLPDEVAATRRTETGPDGSVRVVFEFPQQEKQLRFGPIDPDVFVLRMEDEGGRVVGSLVGFGCHPVCVYPYESTAISADYPGHATRIIEQAEGGTSLFMLGLAGNTVPLRRGAEPCERLGKALGGEALRRLQGIRTSAEVMLKGLCRQITLPAKEVPSSEDAAEEATQDCVSTEIQVLKLGDVFVLGLPGEVLVEVGLEIKRRAGLESLFVVTLANDALGYVCHSQAYDEGGYEPGSGTHLAKGAGEIVIEQALALIDEIQQTDESESAVRGADDS